MDAHKTTSKIKINNKQSTSSDSNADLKEYSSFNANMEFKKHLELLQHKIQMMRAEPSTKEQLYGYFFK